MMQGVDVGAAYRGGREDVAGLVRSLRPEQLLVPVPASPGWTVHDVVSHLTGVAADVGGGMPDQEQSTAAVERRVGDPTSIVLREWERASRQIEVILTKSGRGDLASVIDVVVREHDIRAAVGLPGNRDSLLVEIAVARAVELWFAKLESAGLPDVVVRDDSDAVVAGRPDARVTFGSSRFELFRSAYGRRSSSQIERRLDGADDPAAYVPILCVQGPAVHDVIE